MDKHLHILSFDIPFPADYGGVIDVFFKIKALHAAGVRIHLHCFEYGRPRQKILERLCASVDYYPRKTGFRGLSAHLPYIVNSRRSPLLIENLLKDDYPILLEGIHCSYLLNDARFDSRQVLLRLHNVEHLYYRGLRNATRSWFRKLYYAFESRFIHSYEQAIAGKTTILALSKVDMAFYQQKFEARSIVYIPVFLPYECVASKEGKGNYCLYHGNLSVPENEKVVTWLAKHVFGHQPIPFVVAGKNPSARLSQALEKNPNCCVIANPSDDEMDDLISKAHINILPSFNDTGIKLKLLNALFNGRHCITNSNAVTGGLLENVCHIGDSPQAIRNLVASLLNEPFTQDHINQRKTLLEGVYDNTSSADLFTRLIW